MAHEFGHIMLQSPMFGHLHVGGFQELTEEESAEVLKSLASEVFSDNMGTGLALPSTTSRGFGIEEYYLGSVLFFGLSIFLNSCLSILIDGTVPDFERLSTRLHTRR